MTEKPWSAKREEMWRQITFAMASLALVMTVTAVAGKVLHIDRLGAAASPVAIGLGIVSIGCWILWMAEQGNPNRPAGDRRVMTTWKVWPSDQEYFSCDCGLTLTFGLGAGIDRPAPYWSPNEGRMGTDPGGGRWTIVCPCGRGHYKFNRGSYVGTGAKQP